MTEKATLVAVSELRRALGDRDPGIGGKAAIALCAIGPLAVPELREALKDSEPSVRGHAAWVLGRIGVAAEAAVPQLRHALGDRHADVQDIARDALVEIGAAAIPELRRALNDSHPDVRKKAEYALGRISEATAVPELQRALTDPDAIISYQMTSALSRAGKAGIAALVEALAAPRARNYVKSYLLLYVGHLAVPALLRALRNSDPVVREVVSDILGDIGSRVAENWPKQVPYFGCSDLLSRLFSAEYVAQAVEVAALAIQELLRAIADTDPVIPDNAWPALSQFIETARMASPELRRALGNPGAPLGLHYEMIASIAQFDEAVKSSVSDLRRALQIPGFKLRARTASVLGMMGEAAASAVPELRRALHDSDAKLRASSASVLGRIGGTATSVELVASELWQAIGDPDPSVRENAVYALTRIGPAAFTSIAAAQPIAGTTIVVESGRIEIKPLGPELREKVMRMLGEHRDRAWTWLKHLVTVWKRGSKFQAFEELGFAQTGSLTKSLQALERALGDIVLIRGSDNSRAVDAFTSSGKELVEWAAPFVERLVQVTVELGLSK